VENSLIRALYSVIVHYKGRISYAVLCVSLSNLLMVGNPLVFRQAVYMVSGSTETLPLWVIVLLTLTIGVGVFQYKMRMEFIAISRDVESRLRSKIYDRIQNQSASFFDRHHIGGLMSRLTNDLSAYREVIGPGIMYPVYFTTLVVPALIALFTISIPMALVSSIPVMLLPLLMWIFRRISFHISLEVQKALGSLSTSVQEHYSGIRIVKAYGTENSSLQRFAEKCQNFLRLNTRLEIIRGLFYPFLTMITKVTTILIVMLMSYSTIRGWTILSTADFVSFMWIQSYVFIPVLMLGWTLPLYIHGSASYARLVEIYQEPIEVEDLPQAVHKVPEDASIRFHDLTFSYPGNRIPALRHLTMEIPPGQFLGMTGPVGSGKSTLFRLLAREYEVPHGMIFLGDRDIRDYAYDAIRRHIVYVEQHPFLFSATIRENLLYGNPKATQEQMDDALESADLMETMTNLPQGYETVIGERGVMLSGGEKQRLALARAFLVNRPIMLLDDVFSAVDAETEVKIFTSIKKLFLEKTVMIITHRVSVLEQLDTILYIMNGKVIEKGTPRELLKRGRHYAALVELQNI